MGNGYIPITGSPLDVFTCIKELCSGLYSIEIGFYFLNNLNGIRGYLKIENLSGNWYNFQQTAGKKIESMAGNYQTHNKVDLASDLYKLTSHLAESKVTGPE